jgi:mediator of RNA polymerase II transcription subunit 14
MKVERQLKLRAIPYTHVLSSSPPPSSHLYPDAHSALSRSIPALCVQATDILAGAPAAEAAMPNIRVTPTNWWSTPRRRPQVVTSVKLKYVQPPLGKRAQSGAAVVRMSRRIVYDADQAVVSFLSEDVDSCVDEFLEEWAKVSKMVVIAREGKHRG